MQLWCVKINYECILRTSFIWHSCVIWCWLFPLEKMNYIKIT